MSLQEGGKRDGFTSKFGIIAAAAGSAIGLGNIWRFPYVVGDNGGGAFLLIYLGFVLLLGIPVMLSEFVIGRRAKKNAFGALKELAPGTLWPVIGVMGIVAAFTILAFYSTIAGWTLHYIYLTATNGFQNLDTEAIAELFDTFQASGLLPVIWQVIFLGLTAGIIIMGVKKGIERYSKILMPLLLLLLILISIRSLTMTGSWGGVSFLFKPDFSLITSNVVLSALGQAFFSLSIGMGALITYASYFPKRTNLASTAFEVSIADVVIAILAGIAIFPAMSALGMLPGVDAAGAATSQLSPELMQGPGLIFKVLPNVFQLIPGGYAVGVAFFILLSIAALTSSISIMEVVVAFLVEEFKLARVHATAMTTVAAGFIGIFCTLNVAIAGTTVFDALDFTASNILLPLGGLLIVVFVGWYMAKSHVYEEMSNEGLLKVKLLGVFMFIVRFIAPIAIAIVFLNGIGFL